LPERPLITKTGRLTSTTSRAGRRSRMTGVTSFGPRPLDGDPRSEGLYEASVGDVPNVVPRVNVGSLDGSEQHEIANNAKDGNHKNIATECAHARAFHPFGGRTLQQVASGVTRQAVSVRFRVFMGNLCGPRAFSPRVVWMMCWWRRTPPPQRSSRLV
jgi:hypothetical protein